METIILQQPAPIHITVDVQQDVIHYTTQSKTLRVTLQQSVVNVMVMGGNQVVNETPIGLVNGSNATFYSQEDFIPETVEVYIEGVILNLGIDYTTSGSRTIHFLMSPLAGERIWINYSKPTIY